MEENKQIKKKSKKKGCLTLIGVVVLLVVLSHACFGGVKNDEKYRSDVREYVGKMEEMEKKYDAQISRIEQVNKLMAEGLKDNFTIYEILQSVSKNLSYIFRDISDIENPKGDYKKELEDMKVELRSAANRRKEGIEVLQDVVNDGNMTPDQKKEIEEKFKMANDSILKYRNAKESLLEKLNKDDNK